MPRTAPDRATTDRATAALSRGEAPVFPPYVTLSDTEAAAVNRWATRRPRQPGRSGAGIGAAASLVGMSRTHLNYACSPTAEKRKPLSFDTLVAILRVLLCDRQATYDLRRVATDDVQAAMDAAVAHDVFRARVMAGAGFVVQLVPV